MWRKFIESGGWWVLGQAVLMPLVAVLGLLFPGNWSAVPTRVIGLCLMALGALFGLCGARVLRGNRTIFPKPRPNSELVCHGVYRIVRHPLYTSLILLSAGWGVFRASWPALAGGLVLAGFLNAKAKHEERWLRERFVEYAAYARRVRRLIPGIY